MAANDDDAFYVALENCYGSVETALNSRCNMNQQVRDDARNALGELKVLIVKHVEHLKSLKFKEACEESLKNIVMNANSEKSYARIVAPSVNDNKNNSDCDLFVTGKNCSSEDIKKIIKTEIDPRKNKIGVKQIRNIGRDKVLIKCVSVEDRSKLFSAVEKDSEILTPSLPKRRNPCILIKNIPNEVKNEELLNVLAEQNPDIVSSEDAWKESRVRFTLKKFSYGRSVVIEVNPAVRKKMLNCHCIKVMWDVCKIEDFVVLNRCFSCLGYNHRASECRNSLSCYHCSNSHKSSECNKKDNTPVCVNCIRYNKKIENASKKVDVCHKPFAASCPSHIFMTNLASSKINYG